jgi:hypothetical protein
MGTGRLPTAYDISLPLLPSSEDNYIVFEVSNVQHLMFR